ncbi:MAG: glutamate--tRNA ligase [Proteobacteria bacterium]|nr:glutamate--tRNA ligase [Pseudomonadota bacterium]
MSATVTRFAPSPTGLLHIGNARVALINWLFSRQTGGQFLLRLDDTDTGRSRAEYADAIDQDLAWLGLTWEGRVRQSDRLALYQAAADRLRQSNKLYPCFESAAELSLKRRRQLAAGKPPVYDRAFLSLSAAERARLENEGLKPHWRFRLDADEVTWTDRVRGPVRISGANLSDPVVIREDGTFLYMLPSAIDDIDLDVTDVVRGEDHVDNTAVQIQMFEALGGRVPAFAHLPLLAGADGRSLSKRIGSLSIRSLRDDGIEAMSLNSLLAGLGTAEGEPPRARLDDLVASFDFARFGRSSPRFDPLQLTPMNARVLQLTPFEAVQERLADMGIAANPLFWDAVRANLETLAEARLWWRVCQGPLAPVIEDATFAEQAATLLPEGPWDTATWPAWTKAVGAATGRKGRALYHPLRLALTGQDKGPELAHLLPLISRARAFKRLQGETV